MLRAPYIQQRPQPPLPLLLQAEVVVVAAQVSSPLDPLELHHVRRADKLRVHQPHLHGCVCTALNPRALVQVSGELLKPSVLRLFPLLHLRQRRPGLAHPFLCVPWLYKANGGVIGQLPCRVPRVIRPDYLVQLPAHALCPSFDHPVEHGPLLLALHRGPTGSGGLALVQQRHQPRLAQGLRRVGRPAVAPTNKGFPPSVAAVQRAGFARLALGRPSVNVTHDYGVAARHCQPLEHLHLPCKRNFVVAAMPCNNVDHRHVSPSKRDAQDALPEPGSRIW